MQLVKEKRFILLITWDIGPVKKGSTDILTGMDKFVEEKIPDKISSSVKEALIRILDEQISMSASN